MRNIILFCSVAFCMSLQTSCQSRNASDTLDESPIVAETKTINSEGDRLMVIDFEKFDREHPIDFPLSDFCDYRLVKLDGSDKNYMLSASTQICASDNYIIAKSINELLLFDKEGKHLLTIDGRDGPAGFEGYCWQASINEEAGEIYAYLFRKMKIYDLKTGAYKQDILYNNPEESSMLRYPISAIYKDRHVFAASPLEAAGTKKFIWQTDKTGKELCNFPASYFFHMSWVEDQYEGRFWMEAKPFLSFVDDDCLSVSMPNMEIPVQDSIYHYYPETNRLAPAIVMKFPDPAHAPQHFHNETPSFYFSMLMEVNTLPTQGDGWGNHPVARLLVDKKTLRGSVVQLCLDKHGMIDITGERTWIAGNYYWVNITPDRMDELVANRLNSGKASESDRAFLESFLKTIGPDDNNFVIVGKLK